MHVVIIGAGLAGVSAAAALAHNDCAITLLDAAPAPASGASFANGGHISAGDAHPWASADSLWQLAAGMISAASPFRFYPRMDKTQWQFLWRFWRAASPRQRHHAAQEMVQLALHSLSLLDRQDFHPAPEEWAGKSCGALHLFRNQRNWQENGEAAQKAGLKAEMIPASRLAEIEPALNLEPYVGGVFFVEDKVGDANLYVEALLKTLRASVQLHLNAPVIGAKTKGRRLVAVQTPQEEIAGDVFILAAGAASAELARNFFPAELCPPLPIFPVMGYSLTTPAGVSPPRLGLLDASMRVVAAPLGNRVRFAGFADIGGHEVMLRPRRLKALERAARVMTPDALGGAPQFWAGARPMTPDGLPLLGFAREGSNLLLHTGHGSLGWTLCHATAEITAQLALGKTPLIDLAPFNPDRF